MKTHKKKTNDNYNGVVKRRRRRRSWAYRWNYPHAYNYTVLQDTNLPNVVINSLVWLRRFRLLQIVKYYTSVESAMSRCGTHNEIYIHRNKTHTHTHSTEERFFFQQKTPFIWTWQSEKRNMRAAWTGTHIVHNKVT